MPRDLKPRAVLFDLYRTLVDITTDERLPGLWEKLAAFLRYRGLSADASRLCSTYFSRAEQVQADSLELHPEVDVLGIFSGMLADLGYRPRNTRGRGDRFCEEVMQLFRVLSTEHLELYPDTLASLTALREHGFRLAVVSDAQRSFLVPEMRMLGLWPLFRRHVVISSDLGYHKPDPRIFDIALGRLKVAPDEAIYVGDTLDRDVAGARAAGVRTVLIQRRGAGAPAAAQAAYVADHTFGNLDELRAWLGA